jgi:hypothetical protein
MWMELAQWKQMGIRFIILGDFRGQLKPIFDRWQDAMIKNDITQSQLLHEMCGGLEVQLTKYRRGEDANLFKAYTNLYQWADCVDRVSVAMAVNQIANSYPFQREGIEHYFVMSHKKRMQLNHVMNAGFAASQQKVLFIAGPKDVKETSGVSMEGQDMIIWKGLELLCNARKYAPKSPVNGCVYIVESWDETHVVVRLHADYMPRPVEPLPAEPVEVEDDVSDLEDMGEDNDEAPTKDIKVVEPGVFKLTHARVAAILRLQHALVYASIQGRTIRMKHIGLMDTRNVNFTVRHLIVAVSRATKGEYVHILSEDDEIERQTRINSLVQKFADLRQHADNINAGV